MRRLADACEHLDGDLGDTATLEGNLRDLRRINRLLGGARLSIEATRRLVDGVAEGPPRRITLLDVGTGAADIPLALASARGPWSAMEVTAVDSRPEVLEAARRLEPALRGDGGVHLAIADGRSLPWGDGSFDVAHTSMVLHHLSREDAVAFLAELARVARAGVVVNDLARGRLAWLGAWVLLHAMTRNRWTVYDGVLSVRRAWTRDEMVGILRDARLRPIGVATGLAGHRYAFAARPA